METVLPMVSVVVPCRNEERHIVQCLSSVLSTTYPASRVEILVVDGNSSDKTAALVKSVAAFSRHIPIRMIQNPRLLQASAMNIGIAEAKGDIVVRIDAHSTINSDYIHVGVDALSRFDAENVGGIMRVVPGAKTDIAAAIAAAVRHPFGTGRYLRWMQSQQTPIAVENASFGCFKKSFVVSNGIDFDDSLARGEDVDFNRKILGIGRKVLLVPEMKFNYFAKHDLHSLINYHLRVGAWTTSGLTSGDRPTLRQLLPGVAMLLGVGLSISAPFNSVAFWLLLACVVSYLLAVAAACIGSIKDVEPRRFSVFISMLFTAFLAMHVSHAVGTAAGLIRLMASKGNQSASRANSTLGSERQP